MQAAFGFLNHGGRRKGAGRKKIKLDEPAHTARAKLNERTPFHGGLRLVKGAHNLRSPLFMDAFLKAIERAKTRGLYINQYAIESNHIHLIGETASNETLKKGMQSLIASITWALRKLFQHKGEVFAKRYFLHAIKQPREMRHALKYVLFNHAKHLGTRPFTDIFSSAHVSADLDRFAAKPTRPPPWVNRIREAIEPARSWLQTVGWKRSPAR